MNEDYWDEYGQFNEDVETLKESLKSTVKEEVKKELERLRTENSELRETQRNLAQLEREAADAKRQAEHAKENAKREAMQMRYSELIKTIEQPRYFADKRSEPKPKCNKCDDHRQVVYTDPDGRALKGSCVCSGSVVTHFVAEAYVSYIYRRDSKDTCVYDVTGKDEEYRRSSSKIYEGEDFDKLDNYYHPMFDTKEKAQEYVDFLNAKSR